MRKSGWLAFLLVLCFSVGANCKQSIVDDEASVGIIRSSAFIVSLHPDGRYQIFVEHTDWTLNGTLPQGFTVLPPSSGSDHLGRYEELSARSEGRLASIRLYDGRPLIYFADTWERTGSNVQPFPAFEAMPQGASRYSFKHEAFAPYEFNALGEEGPWIFFNRGIALVLSASDHYQVSSAKLDGNGRAAMGIDSTIQTLPAGFVHGTVLAAGDGVNTAMDAWGSALQVLGGKHPYANENDDDPVSSSLGYWTDQGAAYFYNFEPNLGYAGTLIAVKDSFAHLGFPLGYMQLGSWFYPKGSPVTGDAASSDRQADEGIYQADSKLFPDGLSAFHRQIGLPLETYGGWVAPSSPYRHQFSMSGNVVVDPKFWEAAAKYLKDAGVTTYEQGGLDKSARTESNLTAPSEFLGNMASALKRKEINVQYSAATPSDYMASSQYSNLATIQVSEGRFEREKWDNFLYDARMATTLGAQPWTGVFLSPELGNMLLATLSGGPVGVGDALGKTSAENLRHTVRANGDLVKPEVGLHPLDRIYVEDAAGSESPMIAVANSGPARRPSAFYLFAYPRKASDRKASISLAELNLNTPALVYDWVHKTSKIVAQGGTIDIDLNAESIDSSADAKDAPKVNHWGYVVIVPYPKQGVAILGDPEKFVTLGTSWEVQWDRLGKGPEVLLDFEGDDHSRVVAGYATHRPDVKSEGATASLSSYDAKTGMFAVTVTKGKAERAIVSIE